MSRCVALNSNTKEQRRASLPSAVARMGRNNCVLNASVWLAYSPTCSHHNREYLNSRTSFVIFIREIYHGTLRLFRGGSETPSSDHGLVVIRVLAKSLKQECKRQWTITGLICERPLAGEAPNPMRKKAKRPPKSERSFSSTSVLVEVAVLQPRPQYTFTPGFRVCSMRLLATHPTAYHVETIHPQL